MSLGVKRVVGLGVLAVGTGSAAVASQGMPGAPDAGGGRKDPPTEPAERAQLCHLDLTLFQTLGF